MTQPPSRFFAGRRCLVAGGTGFVGSHLAEALIAAGAQVRVPLHIRPIAIATPDIEYIAADLSRSEDCLKVMDGVDTIIHAAGSVGAAGVSAQDGLRGINDNLHLTLTLLEAAWRSGVRRMLVFSSSTGYPASESPVREDQFLSGPVHPAYGGYGHMRRYVEQLARHVGEQSGMHMCIVRPGAIYGPRDNFDAKTSHVVAALIRRAERRESPFVVWGNGNEIRDILHVHDFVRGCLLALEHGHSCDPINIAMGEGVTVRRLVGLVLAASGYHDADIRFDASKPTAIPVRLMDIAKARSELGFNPTISLETGLQQTMQWFRSQA
ncbi:NAD-dependent epimerase/dehydratase family protein [Ferrovibrio terrae]|uniref:NAD-dependent epimerase/dehydratase family protein n=1 Tax=Ferrovibrio terrae TaxID=2594003 RepID=UPI0031379D7B